MRIDSDVWFRNFGGKDTHEALDRRAAEEALLDLEQSSQIDLRGPLYGLMIYNSRGIWVFGYLRPTRFAKKDSMASSLQLRSGRDLDPVS